MAKDNITPEERIALIQELAKELQSELRKLDTPEYNDDGDQINDAPSYKLDFVMYGADDEYLAGIEDCNNWERSWC